MEARQLVALVLVLLTAAGIIAALLYATREIRAERRGSHRAERSRVRRNKERILEEQRIGDENSDAEKI